MPQPDRLQPGELHKRRALTLGSGCKLVFIKHTEKVTVTENGEEVQKKIQTIKPVLLLTGINNKGTDGARVSIQAAEGCVGIVTSELNTKTQTIETDFKEKEVILNPQSGNTNVEQDWITLDHEKDTIVYPRIFINSLQLKTDSNSLVVNYEDYNTTSENRAINYKTLTPYEDYSVLTRSLQKKYAITLDPELVIKQGIIGSYTGTIQPRNVVINYSISNADTSIYLDALEVAKQNSVPKVSYDVKCNVFNSKTCETLYNKIGNIIRINDNDLKFKNVRGYISGFSLDLDNPDNDNVEIKNYKTKFEDLFSTITAQTEQMKKNNNLIEAVSSAFTSTGDLSQETLQSSIMKVDLDYAFNNGHLTIDEHNGIWGTSDTGVVAFRGGGIFTSTEKNSDGEWKWNTGITPEGINASLISTGQLDTNLIKIYSGDNLRFQMNGDGIFAYKSIISDSNIGQVHPEMSPQKTSVVAQQSVDGKQYVLFNDEGLSLIAKKGAKVLTSKKNKYKTILLDEDIEQLSLTDADKASHLRTLSQIKRVEVSWDGFILRNWQDDKVFWADPDTGNLNIKGRIDATQGSIGAWNFDGNKLWADSAVNEGVYTTFVAINAGGMSKVDNEGHWDPIKKGNGEFYKDNDGNNLYIKIREYCFWAGDVNPNTAPFSIQKNGLFHAASGDVGGWSIASNKLSSNLISLATTTNKIAAQTRQASANTSYQTGTSEESINTNTIKTTDANSTTYAVIWGHSYTDNTKTKTTDAVNKASFYISDEGKIYANDFSFIHYNNDKTISYTQPITNLIDVAQQTADNAYNKAINAWNKAVAAYKLASEGSGVKDCFIRRDGDNIVLHYYLDNTWRRSSASIK